MNENEIQEQAKQIAKYLVAFMGVELKRAMYPVELKGDALAGQLLGVTSETMKQRRARGFYREKHHYYKKSDKIVMWYRDALLEEWSYQNGSQALLSS